MMMSTEACARYPALRTLPLLAQRTLVECQLLTLQDVSVAASALARSRGDDGVQATGLELPLQRGLDLALGGEAGGLLLLHALALLLRLGVLVALLLASAAQRLTIVGLVPLAEGSGVDLHDGRLGQGVGADKLVVRGMVGHDDDAHLAGDALRCPREVAGLQAKGAELAVAAASAHEMDSLAPDTGVGLLSAGFESALLPCKILSFQVGTYACERHMGFLLRTVICSLGARGGPLVAGITRNTHDCGFYIMRRS
jgi:hypothetical protein